MKRSKGIKLVLLGALAAIAIVVTACSGGGSAQSSKTEPTWIYASNNGDTASVSKTAVIADKITHFRVAQGAGQQAITFMAYDFNGQLQVRADVCVPCQSTSFSLVGDKLVCDTCGSVFEAKNGGGVSGFCRNYPKASVAYQLNGDNLIMRMTDLQTAYSNTLSAGLP